MFKKLPDECWGVTFETWARGQHVNIEMRRVKLICPRGQCPKLYVKYFDLRNKWRKQDEVDKAKLT